MEYKIIEGKKLGSRNFECEGYRFTLSSQSETSIYLRCTLWRCRERFCQGTGRIDRLLNLLYIKQIHNHTEAAYKSNIIALNNRLKRAAETSTDNLRHVFDDVTSTDQAGALVTYKDVRNTMVKRRRLELPGNPKTTEEFENMIMQTRFSKVFRSMIILTDGLAAIFWSDRMFEYLKACDLINYDGTFYVVPKLFYQLFTIFIQESHHAIPAIHVLMSKKNELLYEAVLQKIANMIPHFKPKLAIGDFEKASRNSFRTIFSTIEISGCLFHYTQAIWKKVKKFQLSSAYTQNSHLNKWIRSIMALPMLPKEEIASVYQFLADSPPPELTSIEMKLFRKLRSYIKKEWIVRNDMSVYNSLQKTNNCCEVYHRSLKSLIRVKKPNIWAFMECFENNLIKYDLEFQRLKNGLEIGGRSKKDVDSERQRLICKDKLQNREYSILEYLDKISDTIGSTQYYGYTQSTLSDESCNDDSNHSDDDIVSNPCVICLMSRAATFVMLPCGHAQICGNCEGNFNEGDRCPTCRSIISTKLQIFQ